MKKIIYGVVGFFLVTCLNVFGATPEELTRINDIHKQTQQLQQEVASLKAELSKLNSVKKKRLACDWRSRIRPRRSATVYCPSPQPVCANPPCQQQDCCDNNNVTETGFNETNRYHDEFASIWSSPRNLVLLAAAGATVTTSPFLGLRSAFDASDLIVNLPTMNEDLRFLKEQVQLEKKLKCVGLKLPDRPIIELGGKIEGIAFIQDDWNEAPTRSDINLSSTRLDVLVQVSRFARGFMAFNMDNSTFNLLNNSNLDIQLAGAGSRVFNSRVYISRAFVTIGNLNVTPFYFTIGQMFVPFGRYASNMVTSPLTVALARSNERALLLGLYKNGFYGSVYGFRGDTNVNAPGVNSWGTNWGYEKSWKCGSLNIGAGYIGNIADATGFQITGRSSGFFGFGLNNFTEILTDRVPAYDVHGEFAFGKIGLFAEYIWAETHFPVTDLMFNGQGAKPSASNFELSYTFTVADCPASVALGYGTTSGALPLGLPRNSLMTVFNISIWKNTIASLEYRHDANYQSTDFSGGIGAIPEIVFAPGGSRNTFTAQVGIYF